VRVEEAGKARGKVGRVPGLGWSGASVRTRDEARRVAERGDAPELRQLPVLLHEGAELVDAHHPIVCRCTVRVSQPRNVNLAAGRRGAKGGPAAAASPSRAFSSRS